MSRYVAAFAGLALPLALMACGTMTSSPAAPSASRAAAEKDYSLERRPQFGEPASVVVGPGTLTFQILTARDQASPAVVRVGDAITMPVGLALPEGQPNAGWTLHPIRVAQAGPNGSSGLCRGGEAGYLLQRRNEDGSLTLIGLTAPASADLAAAAPCTVFRFLP